MLQGNLFENDVDILISSAPGFRASQHPWQEREKGQVMIAGCGLSFCAWCLKSNPCSCWRKTLAESLHFALQEFNSANGLRVSLQLEVTNSAPSSWLLKTLAHRSEESGFSSWATPRSCSAMAAGITDDAIANAANRFPNLETQIARLWPTPSTRDWKDSGTEPAAQARKSPCLPASVVINGQPDPDSLNTDGKSRALLNPRWVAQLQGFPSDWLDGIE